MRDENQQSKYISIMNGESGCKLYVWCFVMITFMCTTEIFYVSRYRGGKSDWKGSF